MKTIHKNKNPFKVPENYFEEINERILENTSEKRSGGKGFSIAFLRPFITLAAVISGAAILTLAVLQLTSTGNGIQKQTNGTYADIPQFLIDEIDMYLIDMELNDNQIIESSEENEEAIIEYLMLNEVDLSLIYDQLNEMI